MIKAVLFDVGGTIHLNSHKAQRKLPFASQLKDFLAAHGLYIRDTVEEFSEKLSIQARRYKKQGETSHLELPVLSIWADYFLSDYGFSREALSPIAEPLSFLFDLRHGQLEPREGLLDCLVALKEKGYRLGIVSNITSTTFIPYILEEYAVADFFEYTLMSSQCGIRKPDPEIFYMACRDMGLQPGDCAYVGDTVSRDVIGSHRAGMGMMIQIENPLVAHKDTLARELGFKPTAEIKDLREILALVEKQNWGEQA